MKPILLCAALLSLAACVSPTPQISADDPAVKALVAQECTLYRAAAQDMQTNGQRISSGMLNGCAADGPVANISNTVTRQAQTRFPELLYRRMIARGVSNETTLKISRSKAFWELADQYAKVYAG